MSGWLVKVTTKGHTPSTRPLVEIYAVNIAGQAEALQAMLGVYGIDDQSIELAGQADPKVLAVWNMKPGAVAKLQAYLA